MREIKFRGWHKDHKVMSCTGGYDYFDFIIHRGGERISGGYELQEAIDSDYVQVMQYTGLKDRNGVEIYEGDIIGFMDACPCAVKFENGAFRLHDPLTNQGSSVIVQDRARRLEVVGNIHENPELMENN